MELLFQHLEQILAALRGENELTKKIEECAKVILLESILHLGSTTYDILEIEFYLNNGGDHADPYAHSVQYPKRIKPIQGVIGSWYFHRFTGMKTYTHTRRGLDLTLGDAAAGIYGGILIRSIRNRSDGVVISGPSRIVGELIKQVNDPALIETIATRVEQGSAFQQKYNVFISGQTPDVTTSVFKSARVGLGERNPEYRARLYRFFTSALPKKKTGREGVPLL